MSRSVVGPATGHPESILVVGVDINRTIQSSLEGVEFVDSTLDIRDVSDVHEGIRHILLGNRVDREEHHRLTVLMSGRSVNFHPGVIPAELSMRVRKLTPPKTHAPMNSGKGEKPMPKNGNSLTSRVRELLDGRSPNELSKEDRRDILDTLNRGGAQVTSQQLLNALLVIRRSIERSGGRTLTRKKVVKKKLAARKPNGNGHRRRTSDDVDDLLESFDVWLAEGTRLRNLLATQQKELQKRGQIEELVKDLESVIDQHRN